MIIFFVINNFILKQARLRRRKIGLAYIFIENLCVFALAIVFCKVIWLKRLEPIFNCSISAGCSIKWGKENWQSLAQKGNSNYQSARKVIQTSKSFDRWCFALLTRWGNKKVLVPPWNQSWCNLGSWFQGGTSTFLLPTSPHLTSINLSMLIRDPLYSLITKGRVLFRKFWLIPESSPAKLAPKLKAPKRLQNTVNTVKRWQKVGLVGGPYSYSYI